MVLEEERIGRTKSCKMLIRLWDIRKEQWDQLEVTVPGKPEPGPSDNYLWVEGAKAKPDPNGNYVNGDYSEEELDAIHAFAVARLSIDLWEKALNKKVVWPWDLNESRLKIVLYSGQMDASFRKRDGSILLGDSGSEWRPTCRSLDVVAHEMTHAIIESYRPGIHDIETLDNYAVIEALADLTPIFMIASKNQILTRALSYTNGDLMKKSFFSDFAEGYGENNEVCVRSALEINDIKDNPCSLGSPIVNYLYLQLVQLIDSSFELDFLKVLDNLICCSFETFQGLDKISPVAYITDIKKALK